MSLDYVIIEDKQVLIKDFLAAPDYMYPVVKVFPMNGRYYTLDVDNRLECKIMENEDEDE